MDILNAIVITIATALLILNIWQYSVRKAAFRIVEVLFTMSGNAKDKVQEVKAEEKDAEIIGSHLFDIFVTIGALLKVLGKKVELPSPILYEEEKELDKEWRKRGDREKMMRLADNIVYSIREQSPGADWEQIASKAVERFVEEVPNVDRSAAKKIIDIVNSSPAT